MKANEKNPPTQAAEAATGADTVAVVQPAPRAQAPRARDENHGRGGLYTVTGGKTRLVHQTKAAKTFKESQ